MLIEGNFSRILLAYHYKLTGYHSKGHLISPDVFKRDLCHHLSTCGRKFLPIGRIHDTTRLNHLVRYAMHASCSAAHAHLALYSDEGGNCHETHIGPAQSAKMICMMCSLQPRGAGKNTLPIGLDILPRVIEHIFHASCVLPFQNRGLKNHG